jgi:thiamine transporter
MRSPWFYSFLYNLAYILPNMLLCLIVFAMLWKPMGKYLRGEDLR